MESQFYSGVRVLVTGGASFIGTHLVERLTELGAEVCIVDDFSSGLRDVTNELVAEHDTVTLEEMDVTDRTAVDRVWGEYEPEIVFHLAARHGGRGYIATHPADCCMNMAMDQIVLEVSVEHDVDNFCIASSACVYPTDLQAEVGSDPLREDMVSLTDRGGAFADEEYGWAKLMGEMSVKAYHEQYGLKTSAGRIFTAYGPRENETHAIVAFIAKAFVEQEPFEVWGDGTQRRNFTYVTDIAEGLVRICANVEDGTALNIGLDTSWSMDDTIKAVFNEIGWAPSEVTYLKDKPVGVIDRKADCTRSEKLLGWKPDVSLEDGIRRTVEWYTSTKDKDEVRQNLDRLLHER